jgi:hypothetical protein
MSLPSNGITSDVIREMMPPYHLSFDLLEGTFAALPPPPPDAPPEWRHKRITRLIGEITALKPADAGQARTAAQVLRLRELADTVIRGAHAAEVTVPQMCRLGRTAAELVRTAGAWYARWGGRSRNRCRSTGPWWRMRSMSRRWTRFGAAIL